MVIGRLWGLLRYQLGDQIVIPSPVGVLKLHFAELWVRSRGGRFRFHPPETSSLCSAWSLAEERLQAAVARSPCSPPRGCATRLAEPGGGDPGWAGTSFLRGGTTDTSPPHPRQPTPSSWQPAVLACSDGLPAEQRQLQVRARLRHPAVPGAQRGHRAAHHLLRLLGVPGGATSAGPDPLWPCILPILYCNQYKE